VAARRTLGGVSTFLGFDDCLCARVAARQFEHHFMERPMFKLAALVMGSVFLGLVFATISKGDPPTESAPLNSNQVSIVEHLIDSSVRENIKPILDRLEDLERRTREIQSSTSSDQEGRTRGIQSSASSDQEGRTRGTQSSASSDQEPPCPGTSRCPLEPGRDKGSPCWPSTCERAHDKAWPCPGPASCRDEQPRHIDIHAYKHIYVHKHIYKPVYYKPVYYKPVYWRPQYYRPPWDDCGW
jgi:hypothetical protein